jgi:hypothetical protein
MLGMLTAAASAQENATLLMRSGERVPIQLIDMGGIGFTVVVSGQERQVPMSDVAAIDFVGVVPGGADSETRPPEGQQTIWLRTGEAIDGQLYDISGNRPLRITLKTSSGERQFSSPEIARIVLSIPIEPVGTSGTTPAIAREDSIDVPGDGAWIVTGIVVRRGEVLDFATPQMAALPAGSLIARVGDGPAFPIDDRGAATMPADGQLFLGISKDRLADHRGGFRVRVNRSPRR